MKQIGSTCKQILMAPWFKSRLVTGRAPISPARTPVSARIQ
jgi:hypothetical protein